MNTQQAEKTGEGTAPRKIKLGEPVPILWTDNAQRIARLFCRYENGAVSVHTPMGEITSKVHSSVMDVCGFVGIHLAGKPLGDTEEILESLKLWRSA